MEGDRGSCDFDVLVDLDGFGVYEGSTQGARATLNSTCAVTDASPEIAHQLLFDADQTVCISTEGSAFDTVAYVRSECVLERAEISCDDDGSSGEALTSQLRLMRWQYTLHGDRRW